MDISRFGQRPTRPLDPLAGSYGTYNAGVQQNAEDYDTIMGGYKKLFDKSQSGEGKLTPKTYDYTSSAAQQDSIKNLGELSKTGGYSEADIADLRARGISPIRAIYAAAQRNLQRGKALQGGYSPNMAAATTRMAREQSDLISGKVSDVNAGIAQNVASNRLAASSPYATAAAHESDTRNEYGRKNVDADIDAQKFNLTNPAATGSAALSGMTSLYGITPALASTFGNQALSAAQMQSNNINTSNQNGLQMVGSYMNSRRGRPGVR